jgi:hypothetical protein
MTKIFFHLSLLLLFLDPRSEIRDPGSGMGKNQDPGSGINIPDPQHWFLNALIYPVLWIQIWIGSGSMRAKMTRKSRKQLVNFIFCKCWMFSFEG